MNDNTVLDSKLLEELYNGTFSGRNLSAVFAHDIARFHDSWQWMQNKINLQDYHGLLIGDYIPFTTTDGEFFEAQIAGIDTYFNTTDSEPGISHHIDFITRTCRKETIPWNLAETNNGTKECQSPWLVSYLCHYLNTTVFDLLPEDLKAVISPKRMMIEKRYGAGGSLSSSNGWQWSDIGNLWVPNECEVYGTVCWGTKGFSSPQSVQYPLFSNSWKNRLKTTGDCKDRSYWWLLNPFDGDDFRVCLVAIHGNSSRNTCTHEKVRTPICFRISASE